MIKLKHSIPLALLSLAGASSPACADPKYDFALHGYIRSGILANSDGNRADSVGLMPDGKWRLGNEEDTKIRTDPHRDADGGQRRGGESAGQPHSPVEMHLRLELSG